MTYVVVRSSNNIPVSAILCRDAAEAGNLLTSYQSMAASDPEYVVSIYEPGVRLGYTDSDERATLYTVVPAHTAEELR